MQTRTKLILIILVAVLAVGAIWNANRADADPWDAAGSSMTGYGGPFEKVLRIIPPLHDAIWPPLQIYC